MRVEQVPWCDGKHSLTTTYRWFLAGWAKRLKADGYQPVLKHSRWCLLKRPENLSDKQTVKLSELLKYSLRSVRAYLLREDFQRFWRYVSPG